jgi:hypothetical protein
MFLESFKACQSSKYWLMLIPLTRCPILPDVSRNKAGLNYTVGLISTRGWLEPFELNHALLLASL